MFKPNTSAHLAVLLSLAWWTSLISAQAQEKPYQGTTVRVGCQSSQWANVSKQMAPDFTKETGIRVEFEDIPFSVEYEKLKTAFVAGSVPYDLIWYDSMFTPEFSKKGWLQDLEQYLSDPYLTPHDFNYPDDFYGVSYSGRYTKELADLYGVPAKGDIRDPVDRRLQRVVLSNRPTGCCWSERPSFHHGGAAESRPNSQ